VSFDMMRIVLFLITNIAVLAVISILFSVFGVQNIFAANGVDLDLGNLLIYSAIIGFTGSIISLLISKPMAKWQTGAKVISGDVRDPEAQWLVSRVRAHAEAAGIGMPEVAVFPADGPNAFATGARRDAALVAVSSGLLRSMRKNEIDAVLGHEIAHIANGDMVTLTLIQGVVNTFVVFLSRLAGYFVDRVLLRSGDREDAPIGHGPAFWITSMIAQIVFGILASMVVAWFSRRREFRADAGGARYAGSENMVAALERLKGGVSPMPDGMAAFGIGGGGVMALFSTHPPLDARIAALRANRGG